MLSVKHIRILKILMCLALSIHNIYLLCVLSTKHINFLDADVFSVVLSLLPKQCVLYRDATLVENVIIINLSVYYITGGDQ